MRTPTGTHRDRISRESKSVGRNSLRTARNQAPKFDQLWFASGASLRPVQRVGFTILSLIFCLLGLSLARAFLDFLRDGDPMGVFFALASGFSLWVGILGLRNVLRFKAKSSTE